MAVTKADTATPTGLASPQITTTSQGGPQEIGFSQISDQMGRNNAAQVARLSQLKQQVGTVGTNVNQGFATLSGDVGKVNEAVGGIGTQIGDLKAGMDRGFATTGEGLVTINDNVGVVNSNLGLLGQGMTEDMKRMQKELADSRAAAQAAAQAQAAAVSGLSGTMTTGFNNTANQIVGARDNIIANQNSGFSRTASQLSDVQKALIANQNKITDSVNAAAKKQDTYYTGLSQGQDDIQKSIGGVQSGLTDFTKLYEKNEAQSVADRNELLEGLSNSTSLIRNDIGRTSNATQDMQQRLMSAVGGPAMQPAQQPQQNANALTAPPVGGFFEQQQAAQESASITNNLNGIRVLLGRAGEAMDPALRTQYSELVSAFDANGNLIPQAIDQNGFFVSRMMDENQNLLVSKFNANGQPVDRMGLNVGQLLTAAEMFAAQAAPVSGLMAG